MHVIKILYLFSSAQLNVHQFLDDTQLSKFPHISSFYHICCMENWKIWNIFYRLDWML